MSALKAIHVGRRQLGMEDDDYRAMLGRVVPGKCSAKDMSEAERLRVVSEMRRLGFKTQERPSLSGPYAKKLLALWLSAWNLGIVHRRDNEALVSFVERQTGIAHLNWLRDATAAMSAIEALKKWIAREGGVKWPRNANPASSKLAVIAAQMTKLNINEPLPSARDPLDSIIAELGEQIRKLG